jgi:cAMP-dependent protein kinase regulator
MSASHRQAINSKPVQLDVNYVIQSYPKTPDERKFLEATIMNSFIFMDLSPWERNMLLDALQPETVPENTVVIQQGDTGDYFYIVESGSVDYYLGDKPVSEEVEIRKRALKVPSEYGKNVGTCVKGGSFGELALLYDCPRAVSCITSSPTVTLWKVDQQTFRRTVTRHAQKESSELKGLIRKITLFKDLDETTVSRFIHSMTTVFWKEGDRIVQKGEEGTVFYIIKEGTVKCHDIGLGESTFEDLVLGPGNWFGERAILTGEPRAANVTALSSCTTLAMDRQSFEETIGPLQGLMEREMRKRVLRGLQIFSNSNITDPELDLIVDHMSQVVYKAGEMLAEVGKPNTLKLWLIREGKLAVSSSKNDSILRLGSGDYFGDKTIKLDDNTKKSTRSATVEEDLVAWVLTRDQIESVIGDIDRLGRGNVTSTTSASADDSMSEHMENLEIQAAPPLNELKYHRILGIGAFGKVWLVEHEPKQSGGFFKKKKKIEVVGPPRVFALKVMSKRKVVEAQLEEAIIRERNFLSELKHPFILHLVASYQDDRKLYLLLPLVQGGELFSVLHNNKTKGKGLSNYAAAFYGACVIEALGHFHQRKIACKYSLLYFRI